MENNNLYRSKSNVVDDYERHIDLLFNGGENYVQARKRKAIDKNPVAVVVSTADGSADKVSTNRTHLAEVIKRNYPLPFDIISDLKANGLKHKKLAIVNLGSIKEFTDIPKKNTSKYSLPAWITKKVPMESARHSNNKDLVGKDYCVKINGAICLVHLRNRLSKEGLLGKKAIFTLVCLSKREYMFSGLFSLLSYILPVCFCRWRVDERMRSGRFDP
jgi:hypothetical protein